MSNLIEIESIGVWDNKKPKNEQDVNVWDYVNNVIYSEAIVENLCEKEECKINGFDKFRYLKKVYIINNIRIEQNLSYVNNSNTYNCMAIKKIDVKLYYNE